MHDITRISNILRLILGFYRSKSRIPQLIDEFISVPDYINIDESDLEYLYEAEGDIYYSIIPLSLSDSRFKIAFEL